MTQPDLFSHARARNTDPDTSHAAARALEDSGRLGLLEAAADAEWLRAGRQGATYREIAEAVGCDRDSISPRGVRLRELGLIRALLNEAGEKVRRDKQTVWVSTRIK